MSTLGWKSFSSIDEIYLRKTGWIREGCKIIRFLSIICLFISDDSEGCNNFIWGIRLSTNFQLSEINGGRKKERKESIKETTIFFFFFYSMNNFAWLQIEVERRLNSEEEPIRIGSTRFSRKRRFFDPIEGYRIAKPRRVDCEKAAQKDLRWLCIVEEIAGQKSRVRFA